MEVFEVEDINDALEYFTGWTFPAIETENKITTEDYLNAMEPLATRLLDDARASFSNASEAFNNSNIPNRYPYYYRNEITDFLNSAEDRLLESIHWYDEEQYYTSTSKSFQSLIDAKFVSFACEYFDVNDSSAYIQTILTGAQQLFQNNSHLAKNASIHGMVTLQCVAAAQIRAVEAESYLSDALTDFNAHDDLNVLYNIAYANERSESIRWWLGISSAFNDTGDVNESTLSTLADEYIDDAQQAIVYSELILQEMGKTSTYLTDANDRLDSARSNNEKEYSAAALFGAYESLVRANLALELVDGVTDEKVERARQRASISITDSRNRGIEPVLAVSYYEYAQSLANESSLDTAIMYYKDSDMIAGALRFTSPYGVQSSRYIGIPEISTPSWFFSPSRYLWLFIFFAIIGGIGGVGLGIFIAALFYKKPQQEIAPESTVPRSIEDYYKKQK